MSFHLIEGFDSERGLTITTPGGRKVQYTPQEVARTLLNRAKEQVSPMSSLEGPLGSVAAQLSTDLQSVNREQAGDALRLLVAGVTVARELNPQFDAPERSLEKKLEDAHRVIAAAGHALVTLEQYQTVARQHDFMQQIFTSAGEALTRGLLGDVGRLSPGAQRQLQLMIGEAMKIAIVSTAGQLETDVVERGAQNLVAIRESVAAANEAGARAATETALRRAEVERARTLASAEQRRLALERTLAERAHSQGLRERAAEHANRLLAERLKGLGNWVAEQVSNGAHGAVELLFGEDGLLKKVSEATSSAWRGFVENISVPSVAGAGVGLAAGTGLGLALGVNVVESLPVATSLVQWVGIGVPTASLGLGLSAAGGWIGTKLHQYLERWERKKFQGEQGGLAEDDAEIEDE